MKELTEVFKKTKYPDGTFYATKLEDISHGIFNVYLNSYEDLWFLAQCASLIDASKSIIKINCMIDQQADRQFEPNESFNLKIVANFLNSLNFGQVIIFHPHSDVTPALTNNSVILDNSLFIKQVLDIITSPQAYDEEGKKVPLTMFEGDYTTRDTKNLILVSSDAGGNKPLQKLCDKLDWKGETFSALKARKYVHGKSELTQEVLRDNFEGKDLLIVDDMCLYGGTFIGLAKLFRERNIGKLNLAISHLTVPNPNPLLFELYDKIFTTNSKQLEYVVPYQFQDKLVIL
jgi:ribose-phosphate pyrophosphokinase